MKKCEWCKRGPLDDIFETVFWELPDGSGAIEINLVPSTYCPYCSMKQLEEATTNEIEDQLLLIDREKLSSPLSFEELMSIPRFLKKNYFRFD
ncbi:hypothetical protein Q75_08075 [Bacillus coahuilensis p1.1.43]|uniref:YokU family protein n=1 Tax=Bacillus coahuilensis p1.1.43 TaxID=1150625 RepID=A0A147K8L7_9BACI|nr:YokU family protein [Bacillus coahuilensis]KUP06477.1 hypothetical protein Q75_08075 [Bacillus coahuilensis p1.1.43]